MKKYKRIGIDLAKNIIQVCAIDHNEKRVFNKALRRTEVMKFFSECEPCLIGIETCSSAHYWARTLSKLGHTVKLIAPQKVKPYVTGHKNDMRDAEAICEAVSRPHMIFVEVKSEEQQARLAVHKIRQQQIKERTALINAIRGLLSEFGYHTKRGPSQVRPLIASVLQPECDVPGILKHALEVQKLMLDKLDEAIEKLTKIIASHADSDDRVKQLQAIEGIGPITASALVSTLGNGSQFKSGREFAANLGLVPNQHSSGGKTRLGTITKRGDSYLRTLLVHCARAVLRTIGSKTGRRADWINNMIIKKPFNVVAVALANKTARIVWAILNKGTEYRTDMGIQASDQLVG